MLEKIDDILYSTDTDPDIVEKLKPIILSMG